MFQRSAPLTALLAIALLAALAATASQVPAATASQVPAAAAPGTAETAASAATAGRFERWATITRTGQGYYYDAGQQNTHLVLTRVLGGVRYRDTHTDVVRSKPNGCRRKPVRQGVAVVCRVPGAVDSRTPMTLRIFTRLGDDHIDSSRLPAAFELHMLADAGRDTVRAGAGNDFVNGAQDGDSVRGGAGSDWIRTGLGNDHIRGGPGDDRLVGVYARDTIHGGAGNDRVGGGPGGDRLFAGDGNDFVLCGTGRDATRAARSDRIMRDCESVRYG